MALTLPSLQTSHLLVGLSMEREQSSVSAERILYAFPWRTSSRSISQKDSNYGWQDKMLVLILKTLIMSLQQPLHQSLTTNPELGVEGTLSIQSETQKSISSLRQAMKHRMISREGPTVQSVHHPKERRRDDRLLHQLESTSLFLLTLRITAMHPKTQLNRPTSRKVSMTDIVFALN